MLEEFFHFSWPSTATIITSGANALDTATRLDNPKIGSRNHGGPITFLFDLVLFYLLSFYLF